MRDQLIGYLAGALEPEEQRAVEAQLATDPQLRRWLDLCEASLAPLAADREHLPAPLGLAARTCQRVLAPPMAAQPRVVRAGWSWADLAVAAGVFLAASLLFFPAVTVGRERSRVAYCQNNLRLVGTALAQYSQLHGGHLPYVPPKGYAGWYAPTLVHNGFIESSRVFLCPGSSLSQEKEFLVPRIEETVGPQITPLVRVKQKTMGGSYGYPLGYVEDGRYQAMRHQSRATYPLMSDVPSGDLASMASRNHSTGQNVLFEDGSANLLGQPVRPRTGGGLDPLFLNDAGEVAAGLSLDDAVIGASDSVPLPASK